MFTPHLSPAQQRQILDLQIRLSAALEPITIEDTPELAALIAKRSELTAVIAGIESGVGGDNLEESAQDLANRQSQLHLVNLKIKPLEDSQSRSREAAQVKWETEIESVCRDAREVLAEIAASFQNQHRAALESAVAQYASPGTAEVKNVTSLLPWFLLYLRRIKTFRETGAEPARLLEWLGAALNCRDFLLP